ncbi:uncharacterized protein LOC125071334 isoform X1 [Vanessa atalanta]|uniref:uncharacterized protein LOC125071334 isoform X1 n=1 Tax=Vanessa atalanta TaxID=42275 RepID=UPI001FCDE68F|nr:uncharacterized protein LOC125071334 isoform X1 [Vanessa atalanta]
MQPSTIIVLACLVAAVAASVHYEHYPDEMNVQNVHESLGETPVHERSARTKRGLLLLKKKLILGALGLKAVKVGAVGAGVVGALALKKQSVKPRVIIQTEPRYGPKYVEVHSWSG